MKEFDTDDPTTWEFECNDCHEKFISEEALLEHQMEAKIDDELNEEEIDE